MKICIAQTRSVKGDISANIENHIKFIEAGSALSISAIFFPELSITGYEPDIARKLATHQDDERFDIFQQLSEIHHLTIGIGLPTLTDTGVHISMIIFQPFTARRIYSKQTLHSDEFPYFVPGNKQTIISVEKIAIVPGICYETLQKEHSENASRLGAQLYIASVAKTQNGVNKGILHYPEIAKEFSMSVHMANCIGHCDNSYCVGKSAVWNNQGELVGQLKEEKEGLLFFDTESEEVFEEYFN